MPKIDIDKVLKIAGAAEGSFYEDKFGRKIDKRYKPSYANSKSGLSFGIFQFDVSVNKEAKTIFPEIMKLAIKNKWTSRLESNEIEKEAGMANAGNILEQKEKEIIEKLLDLDEVKEMIDAKTLEYAQKEILDKYLPMFSKAELIWKNKKSKDPALVCDMTIFTDGTKENLHLFAYLLACLNRYPKNAGVFQDWMDGKKVKTATGPAAGFELKCPPTVDEMHTFFKSLKIWDGTQGKYEYLRDRLDPVLARIGS